MIVRGSAVPAGARRIVRRRRLRAAFGGALVPVFVLGLALIPADAPRAADRTDDVPFSQTSDGRTAKRLAKARKEIKKRDYDDAVKLLTRVVRDQPENADAHNLLGYSYRKLGQLDPAREHYDRALELDPKHKGALEYLGELYLQTGDLKAAEGLLERLAAACPDGCEERQDLAEEIAEFKNKAGG